MQIKVKLFGDLKKYALGYQTQFELALKPGTTLEEVIKGLSIPNDLHISLINGRRVTQAARFEDGDTLVLFPPISGG